VKDSDKQIEFDGWRDEVRRAREEARKQSRDRMRKLTRNRDRSEPDRER